MNLVCSNLGKLLNKWLSLKKRSKLNKFRQKSRNKRLINLQLRSRLKKKRSRSKTKKLKFRNQNVQS